MCKGCGIGEDINFESLQKVIKKEGKIQFIKEHDIMCSPEARAMILQTRGSRLLQGFRGRPPADIEALIRLIVAVGELALDQSELLEALDVNPVLVLPAGQGAVAVDALLYTRTLESTTGGTLS